ncbi:MAG: hypothetical protein P4L22_00980 [Candidatus Babeliales bacterium]|nr:hypothetical protein [Candidatus Babeliales bacterium]
MKKLLIFTVLLSISGMNAMTTSQCNSLKSTLNTKGVDAAKLQAKNSGLVYSSCITAHDESIAPRPAPKTVR